MIVSEETAQLSLDKCLLDEIAKYHGDTMAGTFEIWNLDDTSTTTARRAYGTVPGTASWGKADIAFRCSRCTRSPAEVYSESGMTMH